MMLTENNDTNDSNDEELLHWLALNQHFQFIPTFLLLRVLNHFRIQELWNLSNNELIRMGFNNKIISELRKTDIGKIIYNQEKILDEIKEKKIKISKFIDKDYPASLKTSVTNPPIVIYYKGIELDFNNCIAIVGTRDCSFHGRNTVRELSNKLAKKGFIITSGLARGVDVEAHCGALSSNNGKTLAILAWIDPIYPQEHTELAYDIYKSGGCMSENLHKSSGVVDYRKFTDRNRITSELSQFIIIGETGEDGGTIRQADWAQRQNKQIFILRPKEENERAVKGFNKIVRTYGAIPFNETDELLELVPDITRYKKSIDTNRSSQLKLT